MTKVQPIENVSRRVADPAQLGQKLRATRKTQGFTQQQLSGLAGLGGRYLSDLENGKPTAQLGKALAVLELLGLDVWLVPRSERAAIERYLAASRDE
jgi:y4mF family transcriptional regulator